MHKRSKWVTAWSWLLMVFGCLAVLVMALQVWLLFGQGVHAQILESWGDLREAAESINSIPVYIGLWALMYLDVVLAVSLLLALCLLVSAVGLWRRKNWARRCVVGVLVLFGLYQLLSVGVVAWAMADMLVLQQGAASSTSYLIGQSAAVAVLPLMMVAAQWGLAWWLCRPHVVAEFTHTDASEFEGRA